ncbi:hypothetical protein KY285_025482 [Solanum tuberosum]|nr:hypothetical protein KY285_025482 [Solanum tuberosum]
MASRFGSEIEGLQQHQFTEDEPVVSETAIVVWAYGNSNSRRSVGNSESVKRTRTQPRVKEEQLLSSVNEEEREESFEDSENSGAIVEEPVVSETTNRPMVTLLCQIPEGSNHNASVATVGIIKLLIGHFDLDPNRVFDIVRSLSIMISFWSVLNISLVNSIFLDLIPIFPKSHASQILGFKFQYYQCLEVNDPVPSELYQLTALLVKRDFIDVDSIIIVAATGKDLMDEEKQGDVTVDLYAAFDMETEAVAERSSELENSQPLGLLMGFLEVDDWFLLKCSLSMTNYVGVVPPYYSGILNSLNAYAIFKYAVFLMNEASFKHGESEALRSCIKALNFWATEICWELQDFTLNKLKGIEDELIINMSAKSSFRILNLLSFCCGELQDFVLNKSKGIEDELIIKLKSAIIEVADGDGDDEYSLLVDLNRLYELQLSRQISIESLHKDLAEILKNFRSIDDENNGGCFRKATLASTELEALGFKCGYFLAGGCRPCCCRRSKNCWCFKDNGQAAEGARMLADLSKFVNPKDYSKPVQEVIAEMTDGGVDRSVECTGHIDAMIPAFECVHDGWGVAGLVGAIRKLCSRHTL